MPLPKTWFASDAAVFRSLPLDCFPLVIKPYDGDGSAGLASSDTPKTSNCYPIFGGIKSLYLAQEYLETEGWDLKLYGIGSQVWAVRKPSPVRFLEPGPAALISSEGAEMVEVDAELRDIALTCGRACGLDLWGVDVAMTKDGPARDRGQRLPHLLGHPGGREAHRRAHADQDPIGCRRPAGWSRADEVAREDQHE